jgi:hypothetical protein
MCRLHSWPNAEKLKHMRINFEVDFFKCLLQVRMRRCPAVRVVSSGGGGCHDGGWKECDFSDVTPCNLVGMYRRFRDIYKLV